MQYPVAFYFTDDVIGTDPLKIIPILPANTAVIFRHYNYKNRAELALKLSNLCKRHKIRLLIASDPELAHTVKAAGCHLPEHKITKARSLKRKFPNLLITAACHSERALRQAVHYKCDAAFLSPVFSTASHPDALCLKFLPSVLIAKRSPIPIFALGGITKRRWRQLGPTSFSGFGAIRSLENGSFNKARFVDYGK